MKCSVLISQQSTQDFRMLLQDVRLQSLHRADGLSERKSTEKHLVFRKIWVFPVNFPMIQLTPHENPALALDLFTDFI